MKVNQLLSSQVSLLLSNVNTSEQGLTLDMSVYK